MKYSVNRINDNLIIDWEGVINNAETFWIFGISIPIGEIVSKLGINDIMDKVLDGIPYLRDMYKLMKGILNGECSSIIQNPVSFVTNLFDWVLKGIGKWLTSVTQQQIKDLESLLL